MLSDERLKMVKDAVNNGVFIMTSFRGWKGMVSWTFSEKSIKTCDLKPLGIREISGVSYIQRIMVLLLKDYAYKTPYGVFVPGPNIVTVFSRLTELREDLYKVRDKVVNNREKIESTIRKGLTPLMQEKWTRLGHDGEPTIGFVEEEVNAYINRVPSTQDAADKRFQLKVTPFNPFLADDSPCRDHIDIGVHNMAVMRAVYDAILKKRVSLLNVCGRSIEKIDDNISPAAFWKMNKTLFKKMNGYKKGLFYDDEPLIELVSDFMDKSIISTTETTPEEVRGRLKAIKDYVVNHRFYLVGLYVE